jgi:hypothetical protein
MFTSRLALDMSTEGVGVHTGQALKDPRARSTLRYSVIPRQTSGPLPQIFSDFAVLSWPPHPHALPAARL